MLVGKCNLTIGIMHKVLTFGGKLVMFTNKFEMLTFGAKLVMITNKFEMFLMLLKQRFIFPTGIQDV